MADDDIIDLVDSPNPSPYKLHNRNPPSPHSSLGFYTDDGEFYSYDDFDKKPKVEKLSKDFKEKMVDPLNSLILQTTTKLEAPIESHDESLYADYSKHDPDQEELQLMTTQLDTEFQDSIIDQRDKDIKNIQVQMVQVNEIFKDLAKLVEDQTEVVDSIRTNITQTSMHTSDATKEIKEASKHQESTGRNYCYLALIITVVSAIVVGVVVLVVVMKRQQ